MGIALPLFCSTFPAAVDGGRRHNTVTQRRNQIIRVEGVAHGLDPLNALLLQNASLDKSYQQSLGRWVRTNVRLESLDLVGTIIEWWMVF